MTEQIEPDGGVKPYVHGMMRDWAPWGRVSEGPGSASMIYWTWTGNVKAKADFITMTDGDGNPMRNIHGEIFRRRLEPHEDPQMVAIRESPRVRAAVRGPEGLRGFGGSLTWPKINARTACPV